MADDLITIRLRLVGGTAAAAEAKAVSTSIAGTGRAAATAGRLSSLATRGVMRFRTGLIALGRAAKTAAFTGILALGYETYRSINAFRESHEVARQTRAVIKSTGGAARVTAKDVADLSGELSLKSGVDDELIQSGANMLLTFRNIRNEVGKGNDIFDRSVESLNDMAAALGKDPKTAAIQLGKALNDPVLGVTALGRAGIQFTEDQKAMIASLVESGDLLTAQKMILREVDKEFGGSARARSDAVDRLGVAWENLEEKLGKALFPTVTKVARWLTHLFTEMQKGTGTGGKIVDVFKGIGGAIGDAGQWIGEAVPKLVTFVREFADWRQILSDVTSWISTAATNTKNFIDELLHGSGSVGKFGQDVKSIALALKDAFVGAVKVAWPAIKTFVSGFKDAFSGIAKIIGGVVKIVGGILKGDWGRVWDGAKDIFGGAIDLFKSGVKSVKSVFQVAFGGIKAIVGPIIDWIADKIEWVVDKLTGAKDTLDDLNPFDRNEITDVSGSDPAGLLGPARNPGRGSGQSTTPQPGAGTKLPQLAPVPRRSTSGKRALVVHNYIHLDGREIARSTTKHALAAAARA